MERGEQMDTRAMKAMTVSDAKKHIAEHIREGCICPCCNRFVKLYKIKLNRTMVDALVRIYKGAGYNWAHIPSMFPYLQRSRVYPKLAFWEFLEPRTRVKDGAGVGMWAVTKKGVDFLYGRISVPNAVYVLNGCVVGVDKSCVDVWGVSGSGFSFKGLMET